VSLRTVTGEKNDFGFGFGNPERVERIDYCKFLKKYRHHFNLYPPPTGLSNLKNDNLFVGKEFLQNKNYSLVSAK
jgi:hypothetical protein